METDTIRIVEASTPEQIAVVRALFCEYATSLGWDLSDSRISKEMSGLPGSYAPPRGSLMLAYLGDEPAGVLGLQPVPASSRVGGVGAERAGELKRLFVRPESRRRGVGAALMLRAETEGESRGYDGLVLTTSAEMMPLAQSVYESLGYVETEPYRDDLPWPGIRWMRKNLTQTP